MTGVGYFTAMLILTEVGDVSRFHGEKAFAARTMIFMANHKMNP